MAFVGQTQTGVPQNDGRRGSQTGRAESEEESPTFAAGLKWEKGPAIATGRDGPAEIGPRQI